MYPDIECLQFGIGKGVQSPLSRNLHNAIAEPGDLIDRLSTLRVLTERAHFLDGLENPHRVHQFFVVLGKENRGGDDEHVGRTDALHQVQRVLKNSRHTGRLFDHMVEDSVRSEIVVLVANQDESRLA